MKTGANKSATVILIVDDELMSRNVIERVVRQEGYSALVAGDGEEALRIARSSPDPIHLLVTDVQMPRMGGMELCETLALERPGMKFLALSGNASWEEALREKHIPFLPKPFAARALRRSIRDLLGTKTKSAA